MRRFERDGVKNMFEIKKHIKYGFLIILLGLFLVACDNQREGSEQPLGSTENIELSKAEESSTFDADKNGTPLMLYKLSNSEKQNLEQYIDEVLSKMADEYQADQWPKDLKTLVDKNVIAYQLPEKNCILVIFPFEKVDKETGLMKASIMALQADADLSNIQNLGHYEGNLLASSQKVVVYLLEDTIRLWSQFENTTKEVITSFKYGDNKLEWASQLIEDPTIVYYDQMISLLRKGNIEEAMKLDRNLEYIYNYQDKYFKTGTMAIRIAHDYAYEMDRDESIPEDQRVAKALKALEWGIGKYLKAQIDLDGLSTDKVTQLDDLFKEHGYRDKYKIGKGEFAAVLNDYAYFKYESGNAKEAQVYLAKVLEYDSKRTVAHINMGDALYELGMKDEAKMYYQKYVEILGEDNPVIPERVFERIK